MAVHTGTVIPASLKAIGPQPGGSNLIAVAGVYYDSDVDWVTIQGSVNGGVQIGQASAVAGTGVRHGASRIILANKPTAPVSINGGITATVTQLLEAGFFTCSASATLTLPTAAGAAGIVQALPGAQVGDTFEIVFSPSSNAVIMTLAADGGATNTLVGVAAQVAAGGVTRIWRARVTSVVAGSEAISWY